ncbi:hypothetical protein [Nocardiopsis alba]|uniref:hypothetical protein n=1 Tax=Nocardiopsis alba TaxID=53437 RepID=UPI0033B0F7EB
MRVYGTEPDFLEYSGLTEMPPRLSKRLRDASLHVEALTVGCVYYTDAQGYPSDEETLEAFERATYERVLEAMEEEKFSFDNVSIGGVSYSSYQRINKSESIDSPVYQVLRIYGLLPGKPQTWRR